MVFLMMLWILPNAFSQETTAGLQGTVKDPSGAVVSGATVDATSPALIGKKTVTTYSGGYFRFAHLPPGSYALIITAASFRALERDDIDLGTGHLPSIDVVLRIGTAAGPVEVTGGAPIVAVTQSK